MSPNELTALLIQTAAAIDHHAGYVSLAEMVIDAPPEAVWPHLVNVKSWIYDFHFETVAGRAGEQGEVQYLWPASVEVLNATLSTPPEERTAEKASAFKTLKLIPNKLWFASLPTKCDQSGLVSQGVNLVLLHPLSGRTHVTAIRSKESLCPSAEVRAKTQDGMTAYQPVAQNRWMEKYLPRLKALAEGR